MTIKVEVRKATPREIQEAKKILKEKRKPKESEK